jgi:hypothetical protein
MTDETLNKFESIGRTLAEEHPDLVLFAILKRLETGGAWDVVVSAPSVAADQEHSFHYVAGLLGDTLTKAEMATIARIVLLHPDNGPVFNIIERATPWRRGIDMLAGDHILNDMLIVQGYVFVDKKRSRIHKEFS